VRTLLALLLCSVTLDAQPKIRALIFSGTNNHNWRESTPYLKGLLERTGRFDVRVNETPAGATAATLAGFDLLVLDYVGPRWGPSTEKALESWLGSGKGMVVFHGASYPFGEAPVLGVPELRNKVEPVWTEYRKMVGAYWSKDAAPISGHGDRHTFTVKFTNSGHPITRGLPESFLQTDELYHSLRILPGIEVLATAFDDPTYRGTGKEEPLLWVNRYGKGRVFQTALGHNLAALQTSGFQNTFVRGTEWAATGDVTIAAAAQKAEGPRVLVVTGGHDYPTSFYSLFEDMNWKHAESNHIAFRKDIRGQYDVLVFYNMSSDANEAERQNLKDFVEAGNGVVVLHHALASYNDWPWWYEQVVGARYLLKDSPGMPKSTYKHDVDLLVTAAAKHPIVGDIGPMQIWDETYKGMWFAKDLQVLMRTDHPTSDGPLVWVGPHKQSRVAVIQLGHGREAHEHAGFRALVKNAIRWAGSR
jgi:type 1 glutamine amidotransferase